MGEPAVTGAVARSPLGDTGETAVTTVARGVRADVEVFEHPFVPQFSVRLDPRSAPAEVLPPIPNTVIRSPQGTALWLGPDEWLVVGADPAGVPALEVSGHRTMLEIRGGDARALLARGCPLDLDPRVFGPDRCAQTVFARVDVILWRLPPVPPAAGAPESFAVLVRASFARYLVAWLRDAIEGMET